MDPLQIFDNFKLDTLDEEWSNEVWQGEFILFPEPPVEYSILLGSEDMELFLRETCDAVKKWIELNRCQDESDQDSRVEVSWQTLTALSINIRGLLAVLGYLIKTGQAAGADEDSRQACLASASLYFTLLSIPGSSTYHVFHPNLYHRAIDTLKMSEHLVEQKKQRITDLESLYLEERPVAMLKSEKKTLVKSLNSILYDLITLFKTFYMKYQADSLEITIMNLVELTKLETEVNHFQEHSKSLGASTTSLSYNAYVALQDLCDPRHGDAEDVITLIMKYLMPHLCPNYLDLPARAANVVWDTIVGFLKNLLISQGSLAEPGMEILIQNLLVQCPDRSEPRQKQATTVAKLFNLCQGEIFIKCIRHLILFAFNNKIPYRIFAQEVIGRLLTELSINVSENQVQVREKVKMVLIGTALSRCMDISSMVRGKAMSVVETLVNNENMTVRDFLNMEEEDKPFPMDEMLLDALEMDVNPLPGPKAFNSMLLQRIKDERALVRKSAMHALQNLVTHFPDLLDIVAPIIGKHCRDPALTVRRDALQALTNLLQKYPLDNKLLGEYIKSVPPRMYDVETKVQEKVLESLQNLVLDKIKPYTVDDNENVQYLLPWKIIRQLTEKKMRKNLSKICDSWVKNGVITNALISKIQSHIGSEHDVETWVLLTALAENTKLMNMDQYFKDYKTIIEGNEFISTLKLEVLRHTWQTMGKEYLKNIHAYIFDCLCKFRINLEYISLCMDILSVITRHLDKSSGDDMMQSHVVDLMRLAEAQIEQLEEDDEEISDEGIMIYLKAMCTLGHASFLCSESVSESTISIVQGFLLDCETVRMTAHALEKFKATGIVLLGQQAMRDRDLAEQVMPILGRMMARKSISETLAQAAIRINAVKALADLCIRFTALVEPYLPDMCICMKDPNALVRETIVVIFVQLLLEDFIKVKGSFFYHILTMLSDKDETIRELTIFLIKERLLIKNKTLISQAFIRSIFHYNNCQTRYKFTDRTLRKKEKELLTLPGKKNEQSRRIIYDFMMEHLDPPSKLKILTKLNSEVLEGVSEKFINVKQSAGACVLKDVLYIVANERMHATFGSKMQEEESQDDTAAVIESATNNALNIIVEGMKKFKLAVMLQTVIKLREFLLASNSPLLIDVSQFLLKFISEFNKDQIAEINENHPDLKKDLDHDISEHRRRPQFSDLENDSENETATAVDEGIETTEEREDYKSEPVAQSMEIDETESIESNVVAQSAVTPKKVERSELKKKNSSANVSTESKSKEETPRITPQKLQDIQLNSVPRIVLRRISTLTYPGIKNWMSPPHESSRNSQSSDAGPSTSSGISSNSPSEDMSVSSPDFSEPDICTTPKPKKRSRLSKRINKVQSD
ncbi:condensin-2 complex subunit D3 [Nasonia vitripennis]|uniref:Condensin complex subunit 1 C-terminal domain-containing protein n=1 Tax=Nasonia vitripennis TaxID=7425 RepID=A0A7M7G230_NASVI|nr:condensin-2 complex subunit D3 [Nasonia vitripennis]